MRDDEDHEVTVDALHLVLEHRTHADPVDVWLVLMSVGLGHIGPDDVVRHLGDAVAIGTVAELAPGLWGEA